MASLPLRPKATAVWLVENTGLTFGQIARFCGLHELEVQAIADDETATRIIGISPLDAGQLTADELARCQEDPSTDLVLKPQPAVLERRRKGARYTPISKRQDKPEAISFLIKNFPDLKDAQISRLIGTTKTTITAVREKTHWNSPNLVPKDPVILGLCTQIELNREVMRVTTLAKTPPGEIQETP